MNTAQIAYALEHDPKTSKKFCGVFLTKFLGTFILFKTSKNSFEPAGLKLFLNLIASLTKSEMFELGLVSPSIFTCPVLSRVIISGFAFKRDKSAVALGRMVLGTGSTTSASDNCGWARCSLFHYRARCLFLSSQLQITFQKCIEQFLLFIIGHIVSLKNVRNLRILLHHRAHQRRRLESLPLFISLKSLLRNQHHFLTVFHA